MMQNIPEIKGKIAQIEELQIKLENINEDEPC